MDDRRNPADVIPGATPEASERISVRIDRICDAFKLAWKAGTRPRIEDYLESDDALRHQVLPELLKLEVEYRRTLGENPSFHEYGNRFPAVLSQLDSLFDTPDPKQGETLAPDAAFDGHPALHQVEHHLSSRFQFLGLAGRGGMGWVFRAAHRRLEMAVAVKVIRPECSTERFRREANLLARLQSPHVVRVHDFEVLPGNVAVLIMEWVEGKDLKETMIDYGGRIAEEYALHWMRQVCEGMRAAETQHIVHRDLKPANILIDQQGRARVADFGLARAMAEASDLSMPGNAMGTVWYMAPEQAEDPRSADVRSDIYSFGATFYHVLTGVPPFDGPSPFAVMLKHKTEPLIPPQTRLPVISERINEIIERCLAKSPAERFASFASIARQLESVRTGPSAWDDADDPELAVWLGRYHDQRSEFLHRKDSGECEVYTFPNGRTLRIVVGDLVEQRAEALVSSDVTYLPMSGGVAKAICDAGGDDIRREAIRLAPVRAGRAVVTSAGRLRSRFIFHGVTADYQQPISRGLISDIVMDCLRHADTLTVKTLAFPLLGTGEQGFSRKVCLDTMVRTLMRVLLHQPSCVRDVSIVLYPADGNQHESDYSKLSRSPPHQVQGYSFFHHRPSTFATLIDYVPMEGDRVLVAFGSTSGDLIERGFLPPFVSDLRFEASRCDDLAQIMAQLNRTVMAFGTETRGSLVAMILALLDSRRHVLTLVNAGHNWPLIRKADGVVRNEQLDDVALPLGILESGTYIAQEIAMSPGDSILLYGNDVTEAMNQNHDLYGRTRLADSLARAQGNAEEIGRTILEDLDAFRTGGPPRGDDGISVITRASCP